MPGRQTGADAGSHRGAPRRGSAEGTRALEARQGPGRPYGQHRAGLARAAQGAARGLRGGTAAGGRRTP
eukprot:3514516-Pleurochrysis_carterae.AAC.1